MTPCALGALDPAVRSLLYDFVDSCQLFRSAPTLLPSMALEINDGVRYALTPRAPSIVLTPPSLSLVNEAGENSSRPPRLLDRVREANRLRHGSRSTEKSYIGWIRRFILFHGKRHPAEMGGSEVAQFLSSLAVEGRVAASTQNQALSALLFLYRYVLHQELPWLDDVVRARRPKHLPIVLTRDEVRAVISKLDGTPRLMAGLLYGSGLRLLECARLRVRDIDFAMNLIMVRDGKGAKDRVTVLGRAAMGPRSQIPERRAGMAVAVGVSRYSVLCRPGYGPAPPSSLARVCPAARRARRCSAGGARQTRYTAHVSTLLRHPFARRRPRHPHRPGTAGPQQRQHDDDLYARTQPRARGGDEPCRPCPGSVIPPATHREHRRAMPVCISHCAPWPPRPKSASE